MRVGVTYTWNAKMAEVLRQIADFQQASTSVQQSLTLILQDKGATIFLIFPFFFAQDFGMSGLSCGAIYTWNTSMHRVLRTLGTFHRVTAFMQHALAKMLKDKG